MRVTGVRSSYTEKVPRFSAILDQPAVLEEIHRTAESLWSCRVFGETSLHVLKAHWHRCTFEVIMETSDGLRSMIGKVHDKDRSDVFVAMQAIVEAGFGPSAEFSISRPLAYLPEFHVLLQEKVPGTQARTFFTDGDPASHLAAAQRCGSWLARFHSTGLKLGRVQTDEWILNLIRGWASGVAGPGGIRAEKAASLQRALEDSLPGPEGQGFRAGHGSFMPEHVILNGDQTVGIDFDGFHVGDPAHDLAWFIVYLAGHGLKRRGSIRAHDRSTEAFLQAYEAAAPGDALRHLPFYHAAECLHWAYLDTSDGMLDWAEIMLDEGLRVLA